MINFLQGDILKIEDIRFPVVVVSKNFFNETGEALVCPIISCQTNSPLHIPYVSADMNGEIHCEKVKLLDLNVRGFKKIGEMHLGEMMILCDIIQGIFDCY